MGKVIIPKKPISIYMPEQAREQFTNLCHSVECKEQNRKKQEDFFSVYEQRCQDHSNRSSAGKMVGTQSVKTCLVHPLTVIASYMFDMN